MVMSSNEEINIKRKLWNPRRIHTTSSHSPFPSLFIVCHPSPPPPTTTRAMEFYKLGERCQHEGCGQLDFLPFTCEGCHGVHCLSHRTTEAHHCATPPVLKRDVPGATAQVASCPVCATVVVLGAGEPGTLDSKMDAHLNAGCQEEARRRKAAKQQKVCSHEKCKKIELVPLQCKSCAKTYCLKHRFPQDHQCSAIVTFTDKSGIRNSATKNSRLLQASH